jgi:flagellar basal-body rod modification protein FlgD
MATDLTQAVTTSVGDQITKLLAGTQGGGAAAGEAGAADGTEDRFLKLLVAQMRNQDPLDPLDNAQVTTQMAQISTVRGVETLNQTMKGLLAQLGQASPLDALGMIGRHVLAEGNAFERVSEADGAMRAGFELAKAADQVQVRVLDANGQAVFTRTWGPTEAGMQLFEWNGKDAAGADAPAGSYRIEVAASAGGSAVGVTTLAPIRVLGISPGTDGVRIELAGQRAVSAQDIKAIL